MNEKIEKDLEKKPDKGKKTLLFLKIIRLVVILAIILTILFFLNKLNIFNFQDGQIKSLESESRFQEMVQIGDLSTIEYTYNSISTCIDQETENAKYYVSYKGKIKAGIDFTKIKIDVDDNQKLVKVLTPTAEIQDVSVEMENLDFIFIKSKYETENVTEEAYKICIADLNEKAALDKDILEIAEENAYSALKALIGPIIEMEYPDYSLSIQ